MAEDGDFTPAHWSGPSHDFSSAYASFDVSVGRSYPEAKRNNVTLRDRLPDLLSTTSTAPLVVVYDETGSMGEWPKILYSKLPYLELEAQEYLGSDMEIAFGAFGDAHHEEDYPVQARPFTKGVALKTALDEIVHEGKGGGGGEESYELMALYLARNCDTPNALRRPICIFIGDEQAYDTVSPAMAKEYALTDISRTMTKEEIFAELKAKFSVYLIRKPYMSMNGDNLAPGEEALTKCWTDILGVENVCVLPDPKRVVDVIFGILAKEVGRELYFRNELEGRQLPDRDGKKKVDQVYKSLDTIHRLPAPGGTTGSGHSKTRGIGHGKPTSDLM